MVGSLAYELDGNAVSGSGHLLNDDDVRHIKAEVRAILSDDSGLEEAREALADLAKTDFDNATLASILASPETYDEWRVGEAIAERHLVTEFGCEFPWPDSRSTRNPNSIGGGVDLIGFHSGDRVRFVFAEVKTSHEQAWPPGLLTSRSHGLHAQLTGLNAGDDRSEWAIRYLWMNSMDRPWHETFRKAMQTYLANKLDVVIYGVLIHVSEPDEADLRARVKSLGKSVKEPTLMSLIAIYLTKEALSQVADGAIALETAA